MSLHFLITVVALPIIVSLLLLIQSQVLTPPDSTASSVTISRHIGTAFNYEVVEPTPVELRGDVLAYHSESGADTIEFAVALPAAFSPTDGVDDQLHVYVLGADGSKQVIPSQTRLIGDKQRIKATGEKLVRVTAQVDTNPGADIRLRVDADGQSLNFQRSVPSVLQGITTLQ